MKTGFTCGSFDLLHAGHVLMLEECKNNCDSLVVGLQTDPTVCRKEKQKPIQTVYERFIQLRAVKYIDEIVVYETESDLRNVLLSVMPDIRFLGEDHRQREYTGKGIEGIEIYFNTRKNDYSSTDLRNRCGEVLSLYHATMSHDTDIERDEEMRPLTPMT
jgi:glycerol-3-phosphate cytidylyltransferase